MRKFSGKAFVFLLFSLVLGGIGLPAAAQTNDIEPVWETPINVSHSGTALDPVFVEDGSGGLYLFWQDRFAGYMYSQGNGRDWSGPAAIRVPFTSPPFSPVINVEDFGGFYQPHMVADANGTLHSFWVGEDNLLFYSQANLAELETAPGWTPSQRLASAAINLDVTIDENGIFHLIYFQSIGSDNSPAGLYYRQSADGGVTWAEPILLYPSEYLRPVDASLTNLDIKIGADNTIAVVWDDTLLETVLFTRSTDGGQTWQEPLMVDSRQPDDAFESPGTSHIRMAVNGSEIHLAWLGGHNPRSCSVYHQYSLDNGQTWQPYTAVLDTGVPNCPDTNQLFVDENGLVFLLTKIVLQPSDRNQVFMQAWDGEKWSQPTIQDAFSGMQDPSTYRLLKFRSMESFIMPGNQLLEISNAGTRITDDVWLISRPLGELTDWSERFAPPPLFNDPVELGASGSQFESPVMLSDALGNIHVFWIETNGESLERTLSYVGQTQDVWSRPIQVMQSPDASIGHYSVTVNPAGSIFMAVWGDLQTQSIYFSKVATESAAIAVDWLEPIALPLADAQNDWPFILASKVDERIYVVYAVTINDARGIYLVSSDDEGVTWTDPVTVLDGETLGWPLVGQPQLAQTPDGRLHLLIRRPTAATELGNDSLFYMRSEDGGFTWTEPEEVAAQNVVWNTILVSGEGVLHRVWQEFSNGTTLTNHSFSLDSGFTWSMPLPVTGSMAQTTHAGLAVDRAGLLHLLQADDTTMQHWVWDGLRWLEDEGFVLPPDNVAISPYVSAMTRLNSIDVLFTGTWPVAPAEDEAAGGGESTGLPAQISPNQNVLYYADGRLDLPEVTPTPLPTVTPTASPTPTLTPTPQISTTAVPDLPPNLQDGADQSGLSNPILQLVLGILPVLLIVGLVFAIGVFRMKRRS